MMKGVLKMRKNLKKKIFLIFICELDSLFLYDEKEVFNLIKHNIDFEIFDVYKY